MPDVHGPIPSINIVGSHAALCIQRCALVFITKTPRARVCVRSSHRTA